MSDRPVLALDLGTSALKAGVVSAEGTLLSSAAAQLEPVASRPDGRVEADPRSWLRALHAVCGTLGADGGLERVGSVVVAGHGPSLVAVDRAGEPLGSALLWLDRRAVAEAEEIGRLWGRRIDPTYFLPKALWLARNEPELYGASALLLSCPEYLMHHLTGQAVTVLHTPAFQHYYWNDDVVAHLDLDGKRLAAFVPPGHVVGQIRDTASSALGIPQGLPVVAGGPDFLMSLLGTGCVRPGEVCDRAGSSEGINYCSDRVVSGDGLHCHPHVVPSLWNVSGMIPASGLAVEWIRAVSGRADESHEELFHAVAEVPPGARGLVFHPFRERGGGGELAGLSLNHTYAEMARAVVESVGMEIRRILERMRRHGLDARAVTLTGGQARLEVWSQIKADITGIEVRVPKVPDAELVGCAAVGFVQAGMYPDLAAAAGSMVTVGRVFRPHARCARVYDELYALLGSQDGSSSSR